MKKIFSIFIALTAVFSLSAKTLYLQPNNNWKTDNARFAVYAFVDDSNNQWYDLTAVAEEDGIFSVAVDDKYTKVIFCRMNPAITENRWNKDEDGDNKPVWNQTQDMTIEAEKDQCNITDWNAGVWAKHGEVAQTKYYLKNNWKGEKDWTWKEMTARNDGKYELLNVVFGGSGVNLNVAETDDGSKFFSSEGKGELQIQGDTIQALDTVNFLLELQTEKAIVTAELVGRPKAPEYRLENGYYLFGSPFDWNLENVKAAQKFIANADNDGEWVLKEVKLEVGDSIKVIEVAADTIKAWFGTDGGDKNYGIDEKHAGEKKDIYFNPTKQDKWNGYIWIGENIAPIIVKDLKLVPGVWTADDARFAVWAWGEEVDGAWSVFSGDGDTLVAKINEKADSAIFVRMDPKKDIEWAAEWDRTDNLLIEDCGLLFVNYWKQYSWCEAKEPVLPAKFYVSGDSALIVDAGEEASKAWDPQAIRSDKDTLVLNLKANQEYLLQVVDNDVWKGFESLTDTAAGLKPVVAQGGDHNISFKLKEAGAVQVIYNAEVFKLIGNFFVPEPEPEPEYRLENGFYLIGSMLDWKLDSVNEAHKFVANEAKEGEWVLAKVELAEADTFKVIEVAADTIKAWFGMDEDKNYVVDAKHAGEKDIYFNVARVEDWKGHIWVEANKEPEPEPLADGYYLVGTFNDWTASAEVKLALNEAVAAQGVEEYAINIELADGDSLKVVKIAGEEITWFPKDKNVGIDADHAGKKDVYFRPAGKDEWKEFDESGFFWIDANEPSAVENTEATVKAVKTLENGMLIIEKNGVRYNVMGQSIR